ncbi:ATP-binding cassette domain-containing protein [Defluviimonas aestuarii]|uniref:thiamine ABC transporter ATP-binding protein n=1 Tax=Albidovulum aestuarii TaxID=1130726 RepID=UPI00249CC15E|nr:ATP-binding cassette domain-containing protein [Defluviimonas aestuarii]MDI3338392.1 ATP-binding cassette domain-containing protein [Defluviimonas aestuarii]
MLELQDVTITQGAFRLSADFVVAKSARVAVIGPSGAGKSTLLSVIAGFYPAESGRILWDGTDITHIQPGKRPLSILFQDQNLFPHLTIAQNVGLGLRPDLRLSPADHEAVSRALTRTGLQGMEARKPATLSGGQQGRVALTRALLRARPLMLLDEPFAALGPALKAEMLDLVAEITDETGATVLMVSHAPEDARRFAPETILVAEGTAHPPHPTTALLDNPPPVLAAYLGQ